MSALLSLNKLFLLFLLLVSGVLGPEILNLIVPN